jgi:hypothetical protein
MGADMTIQVCPACDMTADRMEFLRGLARGAGDDDPSLRELIEAEYLDSPDEARQRLLEVVEFLAEDVYQRRDVCTLLLAEGQAYELLVTGGLSWGDAPTDAYDYLQTIGYFQPLWDALRAWAIEDRAKEQEPNSGSQPEAARRYVLYDHDAQELATRQVYNDYEAAKQDADQLNNVLIVALPL